jgi:predicted enzyme related to lactoylglutathione lyase
VPGRVTHIAINRDDNGPTQRFYEELFDWRFEPWGPAGFARMVLPVPSEMVAALQGRRDVVEGVRTTGPEVTIEVDDLTAVLSRVEELGGRVVMERVTIPTVGDLTFVADPSGNVVGVIEYRKSDT